MPSEALRAWQTTRSARLVELITAHQRVGGTRAGRRWETEQINWALVLRLAGEFQGFARDLHSLGVNSFARWSAQGNTGLEDTLRVLLTRGLKLDTGNAEPGSIGDAFNRFGISWWPALEKRDTRTEKRQRHLERMNRARNAIAHARLGELDSLRADGYPMTLKTILLWRRALGALAVTMDEELAEHLAELFSRSRPW